MPELKQNRPPRDRLRELIIERQHMYKLTDAFMGNLCGVNGRTYARWIRAGTVTMTLGDILTITHALKIPKDEVRAAI